MESLLGAVAVLAIVIFVHEFGHFLVAKWCDVEVVTFSMGFGPTLFAKQVGETTYRLALIPFGGYVRMAGQDDSDDPPAGDPQRGFSAKTIGQRAAIVAAGPAVNIIFAFLLFAGVFIVYGAAQVSETSAVGYVFEDKPAARAGLTEGDIIAAIDGKPVSRWEELVESVRGSAGRELALTVTDSNGADRVVAIQPELMPERDHLGEQIGEAWLIGIAPATVNVDVGVFQALGMAGQRTWFFTSAIFQTLGRVFQGRVSVRDLGGPIMIAQEAGRQAAIGLERLLLFMALISVNLGVINILPIPVLDGGHLMFFGIELVRGRPLSVRFRELALQVGVFLLVALMALVVYNDIARNMSG
jgi:regulator of sigma E protease